MARSIEAILKEQLGNLLMQLAIVQSQLEESLDKNKALTIKLKEQEIGIIKEDE